MTLLQNKTALVTGASRGIGRAIASALADAGAHVLVHYNRSAEEAESLVAAIQTKGGRANAISADLGTPNGAALLAKQVGSIVGDRLDVLVCNAGISKALPIADYTTEDFDNLFATNVRSPFFLVQELLPVLVRFKYYCDLFRRSPYGGRQARIGKPFDSRLRLHERSTGDSSQALGRHPRTARHPRKRGRTWRNRPRHVEFYEDRSGPRGRVGNASIETNRQARGYCRCSRFFGVG